MTDALLLLGRIIFGAYFLYNAYNHFANARALAGYAGSKGVPMPFTAVLGSGVLLLIGGLSILLQYRVGVLAWALVLFLVPITFVMHAFWKEPAEARMMQKVQFGKNMGLLGAVLMLIALYR